jgi:cellobiose phosphorylase
MNNHQHPAVQAWTFIDERGSFRLEEPQRTSYLYFPLANEAGMMSAITPQLHGDIKTGQNSFLMTPVSAEDLHNTRSARNFWLYVEGYGPWSVTGNSACQLADRFGNEQERATLEAGFLWHKLLRELPKLGLVAQVINFVPAHAATVELMKVTISNRGDRPLRFTPTAALPMYGRSADNLRDHRHVTSLLHRIAVTEHGVVVRPTFCFDERGHQLNHLSYSVLGSDGQGRPPCGFFPIVPEFIGEGGSLDWPEAVVRNLPPAHAAGARLGGYEAIGALRFAEQILQPGESQSYLLVLAIGDDSADSATLMQRYGSETAFDAYLAENQKFWENKLERLTFTSGDPNFGPWMRWVGLQPILRRIYGCSFLPHHDYGRGGRGWRDLWQDCLALLLQNPGEVRSLLLNNFAGVRIDGSNATIIGAAPGEFIADRNNICRVWMDHGAWPFLTTQLYIDQSGDLRFLLAEQSYFQDAQIYRSRRRDPLWQPEDGSRLRREDGRIYTGTVLEHLLIQNLTQFYNVGAHHAIRLEGADWNDALDMAAERGESVAFTAFYAANLLQLSEMVETLEERLGLDEVELAAELLLLLKLGPDPADYDSVSGKQALLDEYFAACRHRISGRKIRVRTRQLAANLRRKADWLFHWLRDHEWIENREGYQWFNGYYDNDGQRVEGDHPAGVRMTLTGQVFPIMGGIATPEQIVRIVAAVDRYLQDPVQKGYRLITDFGGVQTNLGRGFGFAYGHKENGAMFSHMAVMYANALYQRGFIREGYTVLHSIYERCNDFATSRIYPGVPEYIDGNGRGMYHYLTGAASWLLLTMLTEVFGVKGRLGDLLLQPKLVREQFDAMGNASVTAHFAGKKVRVFYHNPKLLDYGQYRIQKVAIQASPAAPAISGDHAVIPRDLLENLPQDDCRLAVELG